ncbi:MAG: flagellar hook basal-body protein [Pirellulaceae bacterium]
MLNGLQSCASAMEALSRQHEVTASNLAHMNTPGHRRMLMKFAEQLDVEDGTEARPGMTAGAPTADFTAGRLMETGRKLDVAIKGDGFFAFESQAGVMYSRSGVLFLNADTKQLENADGFPVLDSSNSPVTFDGIESGLNIGSDGTLSSNGQTLGKLGIISFEDNKKLESVNQTLFRIGQATAKSESDASIVQGARELSNVNPLTELIALITGSRHFEAAQRAMRMISDSVQENTRS